MSKGQVAFDFLVALSALAVLFTALISVAYVQNQQSSSQASKLVMERTCEIISQKLVSAKLNGNGAVESFYSRIPLTFNGTSKEIYIAESYLCITPEQYTTSLTENLDGEFKIANGGNSLLITQ